jgi:hypothetical protein
VKNALAALAADDPPLAPDRLAAIRAKVARVRDLQLELEALAERQAEIGAEINRLTREELPEAFEEAALTSLTLAAEGNLPVYVAAKKPFYRANVAADWEEERREHAFNLLAKRGAEDLVKTTLTVELGRGERSRAKHVRAALVKLGVPVRESLTVPWNTLTAWLRERVQSGEHFSAGELESLGAQVGTVVECQPAKERR